MILAVAVWLRAEEAEGRRSDARLDREADLAARIAARTARLARLAPSSPQNSPDAVDDAPAKVV